MSCTCQVCGRKYKIDLLVGDELWENIKPEGKPIGGGLLCGSCIMDRIEKYLNDYDVYLLMRQEDLEAIKV